MASVTEALSVSHSAVGSDADIELLQSPNSSGQGMRRLGLCAGVLAPVGSAVLLLAGVCSGNVALVLWGTGGPVSAERVVVEEGRKVCTTAWGKDAQGDAYKVSLFYDTDELSCRTKCEQALECSCYSLVPNFETWEHSCYLKRDPCSVATGHSTSEGVVSGECSTCPRCARERLASKPWVVIPFFRRDLCKMKMTASSISKHDPHHELGDVVLVWLDEEAPGEFQSDIDAIIGSIQASRKVHMHDFSWAMASGMAGWKVQQVLKLKAARLVEAEYYIVLDAKNTFIRDVQPETFMSPCNTGVNFVARSPEEQGGEKLDWYQKSAEALGVPLVDSKVNPSITPVVMHRQTVLDMLGHLTEGDSVLKLCDGTLCEYIEKGATEFALYQTYVRQLADEQCIHQNVEHHPAVSMWNGLDADHRERAAKQALESEDVLIFGAQPETMENLDEDKFNRIAGLVEQVYSQAGLHDSSANSVESLIECVAGRSR